MLKLRAIGILFLLGSSASPAEVIEATSPGRAYDRAPVATPRVSLVGSHGDAVTPAAIVRAFGVVTSEFRTVAHNRKVGGVPNSYHLQGRAIDVARKAGISHSDIQAALSLAGFRLIESLNEGDHSHFAFAPNELTRSPSQSLTVIDAPRPSSGGTESGVGLGSPLLLADNHGTLEATGFVVQRPSSEGKAP